MKVKTTFFCNSCGHQSAKWLGKCPACEEWNTFVEETISKASTERDKLGIISLQSERPVKLNEISLDKTPRYLTQISELDRALGGGFVPGSMVLLGGDPGIGKSTLILQTLDNIMLNNISVLYVTGEESKEQIKLRAERLNIKSNLTIVTENSMDRILEHVQKIKPQMLVIDSIQTIFLPHLESAPGSVSQVRECTAKLLYFSKTTGTTTVLIGHVTKEGSIAGPKILEHMVDAVLYFEGENTGQYRILRTIKNRYGSTNEIGVFEMSARGLIEVTNPSQYFLREKSEHSIGSCVTAAIEGTRPILTELQALVSSSQLTNPRRTAIGLDHNRVSLIIAVLEKTSGINLYNQDIYVNAVGGLRLYEPSSDLAILMSLISSYQNKPLPGHLVALGEVGLNGEIRSVNYFEARIKEAKKLGYKMLACPAKPKVSNLTNDIELLRFKTVSDLIDKLF